MAIRYTPDAFNAAVQKIWDNVALTNGTVILNTAACPRCNATGEELMFMRFHTCQVCNGAKRVPQITADAEIARRESERM